MRKIYEKMTDLIGQTPMVRLRKIHTNQVNIFAKLEMFNPGGSVKDRLGKALIEYGEKTGALLPGGTIIEPTAGNTGIGLALAVIDKDYEVIFVVPEKFSEEKQELMRALGAKVVQTPTEQGMIGAIQKAKQLSEEIPNAYCPEQFTNPANKQIHFETTGPEIWEQMEGKIDVFVAGAGTAGTFAGVARYLKEKNSHIRTVVVQPEGSVLGGGEVHAHKIEGIGMEQIPGFFDENDMDKLYTVSDHDAFQLVDELSRKEGILAGSSSGAACYAAIQEAKQAKADANIVVIFPDSSERYLSKKIYQGGQ